MEEDSNIEEDRECDGSVCMIHESDDPDPLLVGCDCDLWFHIYCLDMTEPTDDFVCNYCS